MHTAKTEIFPASKMPLADYLDLYDASALRINNSKRMDPHGLPYHHKIIARPFGIHILFHHPRAITMVTQVKLYSLNMDQ